MCGIAGFVRFTAGGDPLPAAAVSAMSAAQSHRGPDDEGLFRDSHAVLAHRRLSILDLSEAGRQPMSDQGGTIQVSFNGEIYNYLELARELEFAGCRFRSRTDTEVLIHGYRVWGGEALVQRLRGMFAFAIWDSANRTCFLARDPLGIKPLYFTRLEQGTAFAFASEVRAFRRAGLSPGDWDREALAGFLLFGSVPAPRTYLRDIESLPAGHCLTATPTRFQMRRYWRLPHAAPASQDLAPLLESSVRRHLISDVPVGVFLSGGVDSSALCALARPSIPKLRTLTVTVNDDALSEAADARSLARQLESDHQEVRITSSDFASSVPAVLDAMDQPTHDGINMWFVARAARQAGLKVVLSGVGGDEMFLGYPHHHWLIRHAATLRHASRAPSWIRHRMVAAAAAWGRWSGRENWTRLSALTPCLDAQGVYLALRGFFAVPQVARLTGMPEAELVEFSRAQLEPLAEEASPGIEGFNRIEIQRYLHDQLLRDADVFSMAHGVEVRLPLLDTDLVSAAVALPPAGKYSPVENKPLLARAAKHPAVRQSARRPKRGFTLPFTAWMRRHAADFRARLGDVTVVDRNAALDLWNQFEHGRLHWSRAWALTVLGAKYGN